MSKDNMTYEDAMQHCEVLFKAMREYANEATKALTIVAEIGPGADLSKLHIAHAKLDRELGLWLE